MENKPDLQTLLQLYDHIESRRRDSTQRQWDTLKYFTTLFSALISIIIGSTIVYYRFYDEIAVPMPTIFGRLLIYFLLQILSFFLIVITLLGLINIRREYKRWLEFTTVSMKLERYLNLDFTIPKKKRKFSDDSHVLLKKWIESDKNFLTDKAWVDKKMKILRRPQNIALDIFSFIFASLFILSLGLFILSSYN